MPMTFFYTLSRFTHTHISNKLKQSLSDNLVRFYPLAGRVKDEFYVDCNDDGVPYIEAKVKGQLSETIRNPVPKELHKLHPYRLDDVKDLAAAVQVNFFDCGGVAVTMLISHKVADAVSYFNFVNCWAATSRQDSHIVVPQFGADALFPPKNIAGFKSSSGMVKEDITTRRFVFSASAVAAIRAKYSSDSIVTTEHPRRPSRIEALSAFLWTTYVAAIKEDVNPNSIYAVLHAVNLRPRVDPPLPDHFFGNVSRIAVAVPCRDVEKEGYDVLNPMRDAIKKVDGEYVRKLREGDEHLDFLRDRSERFSSGEVVPFGFTSLCRFPLYEADFGWGKPIWVGSGCLTYNNLIVFIDTSSGDGIEAWVHLKEADMAKFEKDKDLLSLVPPPPCV